MELRLGIPPLLRSAIAGVLLPLHLAACTTWRVQTPQDVVTKTPGSARLALTTGDTVVISEPRIAADSVVGFREVPAPGRYGTASAAAVPREHVAVPLAQVQKIEAREPDGGKTLKGIGVTVLVLGIMFVVGAASAWN